MTVWNHGSAPEETNQEKLRKFIDDPKTTKKAVEGSMDKRAAKLYPEETLEDILDDLLEDFGFPSEYMKRPRQEADYKQALDRINKLMDEVIDLDGQVVYPLRGSTYNANYAAEVSEVCNKLKAAQKDRLAKLFKGEE